MTIAIYSRKSKFTGKGDSIASQVEQCRQRVRQYLDVQGIPESAAKIMIYEDEGFSGKNTVRPQFQKMLAAVKADQINCVVCYKLDRISRNVGDFAQTYEIFEKHRTDFLCAGENYDTTTPAGRAMMGMVSVFAQMEREVTAERVRDNMRMLARSGRWLGGHTPTGYRSHKEERRDGEGKTRVTYRLIPVEEELKLVEFIYRKFLELRSISGTTRYLVENNFTTRNGRDFTNTSVKDILRNPVYCIAGAAADNYFKINRAVICYEEAELDDGKGFMPFNRTRCGKDRQVRNEIKDWLIAVGKHDGIIRPEVWVKTQEILDGKRKKVRTAVRTPYKSAALLSGLLICGNCNSAMRPHVHTNRRTADGHIPYYYICELKERSAKVRCGMSNANGILLDRAIMEELMGKLRGAGIHKSLAELRERLIGIKEPEGSFLETELTAKRKEIENLIGVLSKGGGQDDFVRRIRERVNALAHQCEKLEKELEKAAIKDGPYDGGFRRVKDLAESLSDVKETVLSATSVGKRELLKSTVERIVWDGVRADIFIMGG